MLVELYLIATLNGEFQQAVLEATAKTEACDSGESSLNEEGQKAILEATTWE